MPSNMVTCLSRDCDHRWSPERDTRARGFKVHVDPNTGQRMIYSRCPKCGHRWYAYRREQMVGKGRPRVMVTPGIAISDPATPGFALSDPASTG